MELPMTSMTDRRASRLVAVLLASWLAALLQPCLAAAEAAAPAGHCDHSERPEHAASCPTMQAVDCESGAESQADSPRPGRPAPAAIAFASADTASAAGAITLLPGPSGAGPPLRIRFCSLRN